LKGKLKTYFGRGGYGNGEFHEPSGVVVDTSGYMMIADSKNDRIQVLLLFHTRFTIVLGGRNML